MQDINNTKNKFNVIRWVKNGGNTIKDTFYRFPLTIILFFVLAGMLIYRIEIPYEQVEEINDIINRIIGVLALGISLTLSISLVFERIGKEKKLIIKVCASIIEIILIILYYFFVFTNTEMVSVVRLIFITSALFISFLFIPYFFRKERFEIYISKIISKFVVSAFYTVILALGIIAILFAVKSLLYDNMNEKLYIYTWIFSWLVFLPFHFLYALPKMDDNYGENDYNIVLRILLTYIVLPVISIYTVVLYIYFAKIIITQVWPKGIVSYLVSSYSAVGIAAVFLVWPLRKQNKWVKVFTLAYTKFIFPLLVMMYISISIRISEFGFTENRYYILIIGIWVTLVMIFININKGKNNIVFLITLAVICVLTVCGPLSAFNVSIQSQNQRFFNILEKYSMIEDGVVVNKNIQVENNDKKEITEILKYFEYNHKLTDLKYLPNDYKQSKMEDTFGFSKYYYSPDISNSNFNFRSEELPIDISDYDLLFKYESFRNGYYSKEIDNEYGNIKLESDRNNVLSLLRDGTEIYRYDLNNYLKYLYAKDKDNMDLENDLFIDMTMEDSNENVDVKYVFMFIEGYNNDDVLDINNIQGYILVRMNKVK